MFSKKEKIRRTLALVQSYKIVFGSEDGRRVLSDLAVKCKLTEPVTDVSGGAGFGAASAFYDGKRAAFLDIVKMSGFDERRLTELLLETEGNRNDRYGNDRYE